MFFPELLDNTVKNYLKDIGNYALLTPKEEHVLALQVVAGDALARRKFIEANLRLVAHIAQAFLGNGVAYMDLIQEGNIGLITAVDKFDPYRGSKFSTYAIWWIRQAIARAVIRQSRTIRLPEHIYYGVARCTKAQHRLSHNLGRPPTVTELAVALGVPETKVNLLTEVSQVPISLEAFLIQDDGTLKHDFLCDTQCEDPEQSLITQETCTEILQILNALPQREAQVMKLRFGFVDGIPKTLECVGKILGLTRERIRQIELKAVSRLQRTKKHRQVLKLLQVN